MRNIILVLLAILLMGLGFAYYQYNKPHQNIEQSEAEITMSASEIFAAFSNEEVAANEKFLDKLVLVSGVVQSVSQNESGVIQVVLDSGDEFGGVICELDPLTEHKRTDFEI